MDENKVLYVVDEEGIEHEMEVLFTFTSDETHKDYVLFYDPKDEEGEVFASIYDDEGHLIPVTNEVEWDMIEEVFGAFLDESTENEAFEEGKTPIDFSKLQ